MLGSHKISFFISLFLQCDLYTERSGCPTSSNFCMFSSSRVKVFRILLQRCLCVFISPGDKNCSTKASCFSSPSSLFSLNRSSSFKRSSYLYTARLYCCFFSFRDSTVGSLSTLPFHLNAPLAILPLDFSPRKEVSLRHLESDPSTAGSESSPKEFA